MERHKLCPAESVILDIRDGHYVCTACGLVLDSHYQDVHQTPFLEEHCEIPNKWKEETKDILTRLLESEKALMERGFEEKRESKDGKNLNYGNQIRFDEYTNQKLKQIELLRSVDPVFRKYYKDKANEYFNRAN